MQKGPLKALLAVLAVAGYQNRDKLAELFREARSRGTGAGAPENMQPDGNPLPGAQSGTTSQGGGLGDLLGSLQGALQGGGAQAGAQGGLAGGLGGLLAGGSLGSILNSGLGELLDQFKQTGHGEKAESWVKTGANEPIDDRELSDALGPEVLADLAERTGLSQQEILSRLSKDLPDIVDELTPEGQVPPTQPV
jgi:uncharacterized protein YidB (DUF937 family)